MISHEMMLFTGNANPALAQKIAEYLKMEVSAAEVARFPEGEISVQIGVHVRGADIFLIQGTSPPPNENMMELLIMIDALKRASAGRITAVLPFYGYARQDRKDRPRVPITAKLVANLIVAAGADRLLTIDLHTAQIQGFFDIPVDHLYGAVVFLRNLEKVFPAARRQDLVVVSPDVGGIKLANHFARHLNRPLAIVDKRRKSDTVAEAFNLIGQVKGKDVLIIDDLVSTATSLIAAASILKDNGARDIFAAVTHPVLAGSALEKINKSVINTLWVTDTIPLNSAAGRSPKIKVVSVAPLLGEAIKKIHENTPISILFEHSE